MVSRSCAADSERQPLAAATRAGLSKLRRASRENSPTANTRLIGKPAVGGESRRIPPSGLGYPDDIGEPVLGALHIYFRDDLLFGRELLEV